MKLVGQIRTKRLTLDPLSESDFSFLVRIQTNPRVMEFVSRHTRTTADVRAWLKRFLEIQRNNGFGMFIARLDGHPIGYVGITPMANLPELEIGYVFEEQQWGKGYATEASQALLELAFKELNIPRLFATVAVQNPRSEKVAERIGMRFHSYGTYDNFYCKVLVLEQRDRK
jgi:ribosomal-protein-alanine N-acetyltransferase